MEFTTTNKHPSHNIPDIMLVKRKEKQVKIIDIAIQDDSRAEEKVLEKKKITMHENLQIEIERL